MCAFYRWGIWDSELKLVAWSHTARRCWSCDSDPDPSDSDIDVYSAFASASYGYIH